MVTAMTKSGGELEAYQQRIGASDVRVEHFRDPASLGELIFDDLIEIIKRDFADARPPTPLEEERMRHEAFSLSRRRAYIANPVYLKRLNDHATADGPPLVVYAESGSGKSSFFAFWAEQYRRKNPEAHVIEHYVGIGATSTDHYAVIRHICMEINERFGREEEIPSEPAKLEAALGQWLGYVDHELNKRGQRIVLILDGLNQLQGSALNLRWIPDVISPSIRLILSSTVEGTLVELQKRGWARFGMQALWRPSGRRSSCATSPSITSRSTPSRSNASRAITSAVTRCFSRRCSKNCALSDGTKNSTGRSKLP